MNQSSSSINHVDAPAKAWVLRITNDGVNKVAEALECNQIMIGWSELPELVDSNYEREEFREVIKNKYYSKETDYRKAGSATGALWSFIRGMSENDLVVIPDGANFHIAMITGKAIYDASKQEVDTSNRRSVKWLKKNISRNFADNKLRMRMKAYQTCVDATDLIENIKATIQRGKPISFNETVHEKAREAVVVALHSAIDDYGLEYVIRDLVEAGGTTTAKVQPKNSGKDGDADVIATYEILVGNQESYPIKIAYQVKQHDGVSDKTGIQQLIDRMKVDDTIARGCFVTTAKSVKDDARELAKYNEIPILTEKELVEWILNVGLNKINRR